MSLNSYNKTAVKQFADDYVDALKAAQTAEDDLRDMLRPLLNVATYDHDVCTLRDILYMLPEQSPIALDVRSRISKAEEHHRQ